MDGEQQGDDGDDLDDDIGPDGDREDAAESITVEITGLSLYTHHGVSEAEREVGQRLVLDLRLDVGESDATVTDSIEDTVDYAEVCQLVALIAQQRSHKTLAHNLELLRRLDELSELGRPIVIGTSRKSFLGRIAGEQGDPERLAGTLASNVLALERGASVFRVHDVAPVREALAVAAATLGGRWTASSRAMTGTT